MAVTITISTENPLGAQDGSGELTLRGTVTFDSSYAGSGGETVDLSTYLASTSSPTVIFGGDDGYVIQHNRGTAAAGKAVVYKSAGSVAAMTEATAAISLSDVISPFIALGKPA